MNKNTTENHKATAATAKVYTVLYQSTMKIFYLTQALVVLMATAAQAQEYQYDNYQDQDDYYAQGEDTLYSDYASHQEQKALGGGG